MPRRPLAQRNGPIQRRTRTGCQTCRSRKIKCDEELPNCRKCVRSGLVCKRNAPLKWEPDYSARGLAFGRQGSLHGHHQHDRSNTTLLNIPQVHPRHFINIFASDFDADPHHSQTYIEEDLNLAPHEASPQLINFTSSNTLFSPISPYPTIRGFDLDLFQYYLCRLCPITTPVLCNASPFASLVAPLFASGGQEYLVLSVMALAARHRSLAEVKWSRIATSLKGKVLATLQARIKSSRTPSDILSDSQIPVAMLFLCLEEILDSCDHRWVIHMRAGQDFIRRRKQLLPQSRNHQNNELVSFAESFFAYQDVISRTACGNAPVFGLEYWQTPSRSLNHDSWTACRPELTAIIFRITELARSRERRDISMEEFEMATQGLGDELLLNDFCDTSLDLDDILRRCETLKKLSVELYYFCLLKDATPDTPQVSCRVKTILQEISYLVTLGCVADLMFSLFTAAVELDPLDDAEDLYNAVTSEMVSGRRLVMEILSAMDGSTLCNVSRASAVIRKVWKMRDLHLAEDYEPSQKNDWSAHVNPYSLNISLA